MEPACPNLALLMANALRVLAVLAVPPSDFDFVPATLGVPAALRADVPDTYPQQPLHLGDDVVHEGWETGTVFPRWFVRPPSATPYTTAVASDRHAHSGNFSLEYRVDPEQEVAAPRYVSIFAESTAVLRPGTRYDIKVWVWTRSRAGLMVCDGVSQRTIVRSEADPSHYGEWQPLVVPAFAADATRRVRIHLELYEAGHFTYWDDVKVVPA